MSRANRPMFEQLSLKKQRNVIKHILENRYVDGATHQQLDLVREELAPDMLRHDWNEIVPDYFKRRAANPLSVRSSYEEWEAQCEDTAELVIMMVRKLTAGNVTSTEYQRQKDMLSSLLRKLETEMQPGVHVDLINPCDELGIDPWDITYEDYRKLNGDNGPESIRKRMDWEHVWPVSDICRAFIDAQQRHALNRRFIIRSLMVNYRVVLLWGQAKDYGLLETHRGDDPLKHYADQGVLSSIRWHRDEHQK